MDTLAEPLGRFRSGWTWRVNEPAPLDLVGDPCADGLVPKAHLRQKVCSKFEPQRFGARDVGAEPLAVQLRLFRDVCCHDQPRLL